VKGRFLALDVVSSEWRLDKVTSLSCICCGAAFLSFGGRDVQVSCKCQFSLFKLVDGGGRIPADLWPCLASCAVNTPGRSIMKGSPIKAGVNGKNLSVSVYCDATSPFPFFLRSVGRLIVGLENSDPSLLFHHSIWDAPLEAIRSVTHLVLNTAS
jgi:hypothetical protein